MKRLIVLGVAMCLGAAIIWGGSGFAEGNASKSKAKTIFIDQNKTDFVLVYDAKDKLLRESVLAFVDTINTAYGITIRARDVSRVKTPYEHEIVVGDIRESAKRVVGMISADSDFVIGANEGHLICYATDDISYRYLFEYFANGFFSAMKGGTLEVDENNPFILSQSFYKDVSYVSYYQRIHKTFSSHVDEFKITRLSMRDYDDQLLIEALIERMGNGFAVMPGSSSALYGGNITKLDPADYSRFTRVVDEHVHIPAAFAEQYFKETVTADSQGYLDLTQFVAHRSEYSLYHDSKTDVYIVTPAETVAFSSGQAIASYSDDELIERMKGFFHNKYSPEPSIKAEQSRVIIKEVPKQDVQNTVNWRTASYDSLYDPSVIAVQQNGETLLYAFYSTMSFFNGSRQSDGSDLVVSRDLGKTWELVRSFPNMTAAGTLLEVEGNIYSIGGFANVQIAKLDVEKQTTKSTVMRLAVGRSGPGTPLIFEGRIYKPYGDCILSASVGDDLMASSSWDQSNPVSELITRQWLEKSGFKERGWRAADGTFVDWEEGNVVPGTDGSLYVIYRLNVTRGYAAVFKLNHDGTRLSYVDEINGVTLKQQSIIEIPSAKSRHTIKYDVVTKQYIALMNSYTGDESTQYAWTDMQQRSVLALAASTDLVNWETKEIVLVDRTMMNPVLSVFAHGFQYADFTIADNNLYFIVRENSGERTFDYHHEANFITFYTIENYRDLLLQP